MRSQHGHQARDFAATSDAHTIAFTLSGHRAQRLAGGGFLVPCPVLSHGRGRGDRSPSLRIGDGASRILVHCYAGCDPRDVLDELRRRGLLDDGGSVRRPSPAVAANLKRRADDDVRQQHEKAHWLWSRRLPISGTVAERYLREVRGISCPLPPTLGFLPPKKAEHHPAMISAFALPDEIEPGVLGEPRHVDAVHLTLLKPDGTGKADMPEGKSNKIIVSSCSLPIVVAPPNDLMGLAITEGVEDALTAHQATGLGAWAAGAAGRMPALAQVIPSFIEALTIFAHADKAGQRGAHSLAAALRDRLTEVVVEGI